MHELTQAGVASGSTPGVRLASRPASIRSEQKVHFWATPSVFSSISISSLGMGLPS